MPDPVDFLPQGYGQVAYEGYARACDELFRGTMTVPWSELDKRLRDAWDAGAAELIKYLSRVP
jgi:hypothetical protein